MLTLTEEFHDVFCTPRCVGYRREGISSNLQGRLHYHGYTVYAREGSKSVLFLFATTTTHPPRHCHFLNLMSSMVGLTSTHASCVSIFRVVSQLAVRHPQARARNTSTTSTSMPTAIRPAGIDRWSPGTTRQRRSVVTVRGAPR